MIARFPPALRRICLKAMAADPADRYASAEALQKALNRFVVGPKVLAVAAGVAGLVVLGGVAYALVPPRPDASRSQSPFVVTHQTLLPGSLAGELIVRVWSKDEGGKRGLEGRRAWRVCHSFPAKRSTSKPGSTSRRTPTCFGLTGRGTSACSIRDTIKSSAAVLPGSRHERRCTSRKRWMRG